ncbi:MAG: bifunctional 5,10-methylenetetrahydrofolate dehydrogenase/5,10-methenyltetrahydrofolate cyclohydrolase [Armatimonadetes bacterium]|nr:bifunctional 5,10-methylenetetrahydrofolate dehydrogenase/5,10-methenyltetrahydrofolate cyclohydrolase [Armatimonadota bacterium]MDW8122148.1 bifunctional 5,10-methylenetetrahydrofolate dehydrogenase/5,10-methenyltetrahydrofolate cyclohydrolase [Armatimonadota bacterium]
MSATLLDGKAVAKKLRQRLKEEIFQFSKNMGFQPKLATILVGNDPSSVVYVTLKEKTAVEVGLLVDAYRLPETASQSQVKDLVQSLNKDPFVHGILVQHPLPNGLDEDEIMQTIDPDKDVDGLTPYSLGCLAVRRINFVPCTPLGALYLLKHYEIPIEGRRAVIVGPGRINGMPAALLFLMNYATVAICHERTPDLKEFTRQADILYVSVGHPELITADMVKPGAVVLDTGYNRVPGRKGDVGDVQFETVKEVAGYITPVPGGIGPMTVTMLLVNTLRAAQRKVGAPIFE